MNWLNFFQQKKILWNIKSNLILFLKIIMFAQLGYKESGLGQRKLLNCAGLQEKLRKGFLFMYLALSQKLLAVNCGPSLQVTKLCGT